MATTPRTRIGLVVPANSRTDHEYWQLAPLHVTLLITRTWMPGQMLKTVGVLRELAESPDVEEAARRLAMGAPSAAIFADTSITFGGGIAGSEAMVDRMRRHLRCPVTTTSLSVRNALRSLGAKSVGVIAPYTREVNRRLCDFLIECGFRVTALEELSVGASDEMAQVNPDVLVAAGRRASRSGPDAVFISCTALPALGAIEALEPEIERPVLSSNQVTMWGVLRLAGVQGERGVGRLFAQGE